MAVTLTVGPPGAGKTHRAIASARAAAAAGERVWWIGLPAQRSHVLRSLVEDGPLLGVEFLSLQQLAYRVLSDARRVRPLLTGTGRLATVGEALMSDRDDPASPGEARLFARAIGEAKRHGLAPGRIPGGDDETARLRRVFTAYERSKGGAWDYDDYRREASVVLEEAAGEAPSALASSLPDRVIVDGFRELGPSDLRLIDALGLHRPVELALATVPPARIPDTVLEVRDATPRHAYRFPNPVEEARWVLRDVKAQLAAGAEPLELAIVAPPGRARALAVLADEYGVPIMDETPRSLADRPEGRRLLDLLELADAPTPSRLLGIPDLHALGVAALDAGVAGGDAIGRLADDRGERDAWDAWLARLEPSDDPLAWGATLVDAALAAVPHAAAPTGAGHGSEADATEAARARFREQALQRLAEARRVAAGPHLRPWWAALLQETTVFERPDAGVALLHAVQASGRRFRMVWIVGVTRGAHRQAEQEDYFVAEDERTAWSDTFVRPLLPRRFRGRSEEEAQELRRRGDVTIVTVAEGDRSGPAVPDEALLGSVPTDAPQRPAGSRLERVHGEPFEPPSGPVELGTPTVERLGRFARCGLRAWAEPQLRDASGEPPWWADLRRSLRARSSWSPDDLRSLGRDLPEAADWLDRNADELATYTFGVDLRDDDEGPVARLDAARRRDGQAILVRFVAPGSVRDADEAAGVLDARASEYWAAGHLAERHREQVRSLRFRVWPILGDPFDVPDGRSISTRRPWGRFARVRREVAEALPRWHAGEVTPSPGYVCRDCAVFDLCRKGER